MNSHLTAPELRLAAWLPCTATAVADWYSRTWRTPQRRWQSVVWVVLIGVALGVLWWWLPPVRPLAARRVISDGARVWLAGLVVVMGLGSGWCSRQRIRAWLAGHWLAGCLDKRQRRNETLVRGLWRAEVTTLKLLLVCLLAAQWVAVSARDLGSIAELFFGAHALAFAAACLHRSNHAATAPRPPASVRRWPALVCLQTTRPGWWLIGAGVAALAVSAIAVMAVQADAPQVLAIAIAVAVPGCVLAQASLVPGAGALNGLLAWTGASVWWCLARVLLLPVGVCTVLIAPPTIAALLLERPLWAVAGTVGMLVAAWFALLRALGDLAQLRRGRGEAFVLIHSAIPLALVLGLGPEESIPLVGLHLGWLLWRAQRLWQHTRTGSRA